MAGAGRPLYGEPVLLERDAEIAALRGAMDAAKAGTGAVLVIQGPPGAGKTELLAAAAQHGRSAGLLVLRGRGRELEREIALGMAVDLLTAPVAAADATQRARLLSGPAAQAAPLFPHAAADGEAPAYPAPDAMSLGLCWLAANLTGWDRAGAPSRPMLLAVDDTQWADSASLRFLAMLADRIHQLPVVMAIAVRDGEDGSDAPVLRRLTAHPHGRSLVPAPLTTAAVSHLVTAAFPSAGRELAESVAHTSGGNPFLAGELLRSLQADGVTPAPATVAGLVPDTVSRSVLARLARLPAAAGALAASLAVLGDGTPLSRAAVHANLDLVAAEQAADTLAEARLLQPGNPLMFTHPLVGAAVHTDLPAFARARAHRRAADLLIADGEAVEKAAGHLLAAEPQGDGVVVDVLRQAADQAIRCGDPAAASRLLARAVAEPPRPAQRGELLIELARAQITAGDMTAHASLTEALTVIEGAGVRAQALALLAYTRKGRDDLPGAAEAWEAALDLLDPNEPHWQDVLAGYLTIATFHPPLRRHADRHLFAVLDNARRGQVPNRPSLSAHVTLRLALAGDPLAQVRRLAEHAMAADPLVDQDGGHGALMGLTVHALVIAGDLEAAESAADTALSAARRQGDVLAYGYASYHRALARLNRGALTAARADLEAAQIPYGAGWTATSGWNAWLLARVCLEQGDHAGVHQALRLGGDRPADSMEAALLRHVHAQLALAEGEPATALESARTAGRCLKENYDIDHPGLLPWRNTAALAAHHLGDHDQARQLAAEAVDRAQAVGVAQAIGTAQRLAALVAHPRTDVALLTEAATTLQCAPAALEYARTLVDLGAALRRAGHHNASRQPLRQGLALADRMHARPLAERARTELHTLGLRPRRAAVTGVDALTPGERRVALLALHGQSNRQIAQALFIATKTVETHLARAYRKLAITGRRELNDALAPDPRGRLG
jgi:DNA-binding CsgD family transcriptional regulator